MGGAGHYKSYSTYLLTVSRTMCSPKLVLGKDFLLNTISIKEVNEFLKRDEDGNADEMRM